MAITSTPARPILLLAASLLLAAPSLAANEQIYICAIIPDTQTARASQVNPTTLETRIKWLVDMRFAFNQNPQAFYDHFDPADFSDANWSGRTGAYGLPIRCVLHVGDVVESESAPDDLGLLTYIEHEKAMKLLMNKSYKNVEIPYLVSAGNHDRSPNPEVSPPPYGYCQWIDFFGSAHYAGYPWFKGANPAFVENWLYHCNAEGFERKEDTILHAVAHAGPAGNLGLMALGWELLAGSGPAEQPLRDELWGYVKGVIQGTGMPWLLVSHSARWPHMENGSCVDQTPEFTAEVTKTTPEIALHVGGHWFGDADNTDPPWEFVCECWDNNSTNDLQLSFVSGCFNHQGWENVPSTKGPVSLLIFDEQFGDGAGRMWFRAYDPVLDDWYEDADSSGLLTPIHFQARRTAILQSEAPALGHWGIAAASLGIALLGAARLRSRR